MATNDSVRERLPGNHYHLRVLPDPSNNFSAHYLDQHRAHHYHAQHTVFPHADHLYAYGRFADLGESGLPGPIPDFHGLYCLDLEPPTILPDDFGWMRGWMRGRNWTARFVFSNELAGLLDNGYKVSGVRAAWGSRQTDPGLPLIATWAQQQLDQHHDAKWLKPLLLSVYGTLATRPRESESIFRLARSGELVTMFTGQRKLTGRLARGRMKLEPGTANVLHRGMIEAATRLESVGLAQWLQWRGHRILSIYADAVIVETDDDKPLPPLPDPWRCKRELSHLQFINQQAFKSDTMTKLPGVIGRDLKQYRQKTPGHAPRRRVTEVPTGRKILTDKRI